MIRLYLFIASLFSCATYAAEESGTGPIFDAITHIVGDIKKDLPEFAPKAPRVAIIGITMSENLRDDVKEFLLRRLEALGGDKENFRFIQCKDCFTVRAETEGDSVYVRKGVTSDADIRKMLSPLSVKSYAEVNLSYTGTRVELILNIYSLQDRSLVWTNQYRQRVLSLGRKGFQVSLAGGQILKISSPKAYPFGVSLFLAEKIYGFGEFGLGGFMTTSDGIMKTYYSGGPMIRLNLNEIFNMPWSWGALLFGTRVHYGWLKKNRDLLLGAGFKLELGSIYHMDFEFLRGSALEAQRSGGNDEPPATTADGERVLKALPPSLFIGFGFDLG